jgi:hypothetical protein
MPSDEQLALRGLSFAIGDERPRPLHAALLLLHSVQRAASAKAKQSRQMAEIQSD